MSQQVIIFDTTLRDGEQALQASLSVKEKLQIALALERMGVDVMEVGFPRALLQTPVHREIEIRAKGRKPFSASPASPCLLIFSHTGISGRQLIKPVQQILVSRVDDGKDRHSTMVYLLRNLFLI